MKLILIFFALVALTHGVLLPKSLEDRVVGGEDAAIGEIPYQVSLQNRHSNKHFCGGSIINKSYVVTSARCVDRKDPQSIQVFAGATDLRSPSWSYLVEKIIIHPDYNERDSWRNDIALVKVNVPFKFSKAISIIELPPRNLELPVGTSGVVSGWGTYDALGGLSWKLQRVKVKLTGHAQCKLVNKPSGNTVNAENICALMPDVASGPCRNDLGGPLVIKEKLLGISSWYSFCGSPIYPSVYTRVTKYVDWIKKNAI